QEDHALSAARCQKLTFRRKCKDIQDAFAPFEFIQNFAVIRLPDVIARGQVFALGRKGERSESSGTIISQDLARGNIPAKQVSAAGDQGFAIRENSDMGKVVLPPAQASQARNSALG